MMIIKNCPVTKSDAVVINAYSESHTGVDISTDVIYSASKGCVLYVGRDENNYKTVTVSILDSNCCFNYKHVSSLNVSTGDNINQGYVIGYCEKFVHVEFCNTQSSKYPLRVGSACYYKHDPTDKLSGTYLPDASYAKNAQISLSVNNNHTSRGQTDMPVPSIIFILSDNKGD